MTRRQLFALIVSAMLFAAGARADQFIALETGKVRGDPAELGWSQLQVGFRVSFPVPASGRKFMERQYDIIDAVEHVLARTKFDPDGGPDERKQLERIVAAAVTRMAPRGTVSRVFDFWVDVTR
jgi:hypothetical protein